MSHQAHTSFDTFNAAEMLLRSASGLRADDAVAFLHDDTRVTYADLRKLVPRTATWLRARGVAPDERVLLSLPNGIELVFGFLGCLWIGAIPVLVSAGSKSIEAIIEDCTPVLWLTTAREQAALGLRPGAISAPRVFGESELYRDIACMNPSSPRRGGGLQPAFMLYSSGTTGRPKGILHGQRDMFTCAANYARELLGLAETDLCYAVAPISFAYGLGASVYFPLYLGAAAVLAQPANAFDIAADLLKYRPSIFWATPATYASLLAASEVTKVDLSSVRLCVSAAEPLPAALAREFQVRFNLEVCEGLGTTEMLHIFVSNRPGACCLGSPGRAVTGYSLRILDPDGRPLGPGEIGELEVRGESRMLRYWADLPIRGDRRDGCTMLTGDRCALDVQGNLQFFGRVDDLLKINGLWVSPVEVEHVLSKHAHVRACVVLGLEATADRRARLMAAIQPSPGTDVDKLRSELRQLARSSLPPHMVPTSLHITNTLPRTPSGKIDRRALMSQLPDASEAP